MNEQMYRDNQALIAFWDQALTMSEEDRTAAREADPEEWKELAPSEKLFRAAEMLGRRKKVLDYGCGNAWASVIAAKSGCEDVTAADPAAGAIDSAGFFADLFGVSDRVHAVCVPGDWLKNVPSGTFDGFLSSNVLDTVPPETATEILREAARTVTDDADVIIGLNFYLSPEKAAEKGMTLADGCRVYLDGVLRLVSHTDAEWAELFSPYFTVERLEHFAWPGEPTETRRLFFLRKAGSPACGEQADPNGRA